MLDRPQVRHDLVIRDLTVSAVTTLSPSLRRVTFTSPDLADFSAPGPADHVKLFLPDAQGVIHAPQVDAEGRLQRPAQPLISRDYTPRAWRRVSRAPREQCDYELDIDFVLHASGPASDWARQARPGDRLVVAGPRGSRIAPAHVRHAVLIADATALPALARWLQTLASSTRVDVLVWGTPQADAGYLDDRLRQRIDRLTWVAAEDGDQGLVDAVAAHGFAPGTFVWAAGEATALIAVRRHLRSTETLDRGDIDVQGYWKQGVTALDHHAPLDPASP